MLELVYREVLKISVERHVGPNPTWGTMKKKIQKKYYKKQRARKGYSDKDLWSFDSYLAKIIYKGIKELKEIQNQFFIIEDDYFKDLDIIINGFKMYSQDQFEYTGTTHQDFKTALEDPTSDYNQAWELLKKHFSRLWW